MRAATAIVARARYHTMARPAEHECLFTGTFRLDRTRIAPGVARTVPPADAVAALSAAGATTRALVVHSGNPALLGGGGTAVAASTLLSAPLAPTLEALGVPLADALAATSPAATCIVLGVHDADGASWAIIDVTGIDVAPGDEVVLIGSQGDQEITAREVAATIGTIPWEIICRLGSRIERTY